MELSVLFPLLPLLPPVLGVTSTKEKKKGFSDIRWLLSMDAACPECDHGTMSSNGCGMAARDLLKIASGYQSAVLGGENDW
jgi:hypothetical protein